MRVLVGYASRFGSTRDIAMRIADRLRTHGNEVDVRSVEEISSCDPYDAVVFGSGVYDGSWTAEATGLMRRHAAALAQKPVWLFTVGSFGDRHAPSRPEGRAHAQAERSDEPCTVPSTDPASRA